MTKCAIFLSGKGSNFINIIEKINLGKLPRLKISIVISNNRDQSDDYSCTKIITILILQSLTLFIIYLESERVDENKEKNNMRT